MRLFTASGASRAIACPASVALEQWPDKTSEAAQRGTDVHAYIADALVCGREVALLATKRKKTCERINIEAINGLIAGDAFKCEVPMAYDVNSGECFNAKVVDRVYYLLEPRNGDTSTEGMVCGTADLVVWRNGWTEHYDFKTGKSVGPACDNEQLLTLSVMLEAMGECPRVQGIIYIDLSDGSVALDDANIEGKLDGFAATVKGTALEIEIAALEISMRLEPTLNPSNDACMWCRAKCKYKKTTENRT